MKPPVLGGSAHTFLRLALVLLIFVCLTHRRAEAQNPNCPGCAVIFAGDDTSSVSHACFTNNRSESSCPANPFTLHVPYGQTVDFFQPNAQTFNFHTATSGTCSPGCSPDGIFNTGNMTSGTDYTVNLNPGTYNYYCIPHGSAMRGVLVVDPDSTSVSITNADINPAVVNQTVTFTVQVVNTSGTGLTASGQIQLYDGFTAITGLLPITFSRTVMVSFSTAGSHSLSVFFSDAAGKFAASSNLFGFSETVQDFSINISNPSGSALPGANYDYSGTLTALSGYSAAVNITCTSGGTAPPATCVLLSPSNPVPMGSAFTVRASNPSPAPTFSFNIRAASASGFSDIQSFPVTLNVGSFNLGAVSPNSVNVAQGNASAAMNFQVSALGSFSGTVALNCPSNPAGVTCIFANGASTQNLSLGIGQTVNDTLVLNTSSSLPINNYSIVVQAVAGTAPAQQRTITLHEVAGGPASVTIVYFGPAGNQGWPSGPTFVPMGVVPVGQSYSFRATAVNYNNWNGSGLTNTSTGVQMLIRFAEPVASASAIVTAPNNIGGTDSCGPLTNSVEILCNLNTIPYISHWWSEVTVTVSHLGSSSILPRSEDVTVQVTSTNSNLGYPNCPPTYANGACNSIASGTPLRIRPMMRPALKSGSPNPR